MSSGRIFVNVWSDVASRSNAPAVPPSALASARTISVVRSRGRSLRYAIVLATPAGHSATAVVAFAATGGTPTRSIDGNTRKLPPPATELIAPPTVPAAKRSAEVASDINRRD